MGIDFYHFVGLECYFGLTPETFILTTEFPNCFSFATGISDVLAIAFAVGSLAMSSIGKVVFFVDFDFLKTSIFYHL